MSARVHIRLSPAGEIRALERLAQRRNVNTSLTAHVERTVTMQEIAHVEIVEPFVKLGSLSDEGSMNLDEATSRSLYALAWSKLEQGLVEANALYNESPTEQEFIFNRAKRLLWAVTDLKQAAEVIYFMTAMPDDADENA